MSGSLDHRRPSASLRTRRPSAVYENGPPAEPVPLMPTNHLTPYFPGQTDMGPANGTNTGSSRPPLRNAKSTDSDGRSRGSRGGSNTPGIAGGPGAVPGESSKVGALLLNKRQSISFGKSHAAAVRAGVRAEPMPRMPDGIPGRQQGFDGHVQQQQQQQGRPPAMHGSTGKPLTAGEELIATAGRGPNGSSLNDLLKEEFVTDHFLKAHMSANALSNPALQLEELRKLKMTLTGLLDGSQATLQTNVISNYAELIKVSKEVSALENEMLELKVVLEEWKTVPEGLEVEQSFDAASPVNNTGFGGSKPNRRNSLADLQALYRTQLEALWEAVEGAQRFLPAAHGRHVLGRHSGWIELNSATYRPRQAVILILLNDALLVAVEKRRQAGGATRIVADKCFTLNEIAVTDLRDAGDLTNAIRIKRDREVHIFRNEKAEDKKGLLTAFKKILEDTMQKRRKQSVWEAEHRRETAHSGNPKRASMVEASQGAPLASFRPATVFPFLGSDYPSGKDLGWIDDVSDKLTMHIALHEFEDAIALIEKAKSIFTIISANPLAEQLLRSKVEQRSNEVSTVLLATLSDTSIRKTGVVRTSGWLMRLGQGERARETFLAGRGELLKQRTGEISFTSQNAGYAAGNEAAAAQALVEEVAQLSFVCFTLIRNTCEWYMAAYKDHQTASSFVRWASTQVDLFAEVFRRHVYSSASRDQYTVGACRETATAQAQMLKDVGLDFAFLLSDALSYRPPPPLPPRDIIVDDHTHNEDVAPDEANHYETIQPLAFKKKSLPADPSDLTAAATSLS